MVSAEVFTRCIHQQDFTLRILAKNEKANIEIVKIILKELGKPESLITYVTDRKGHDQRYAIDPTKANRELGWGPITMFADGIKLTIQWYKEHMDWMAECTSGEYMNYYEQMYENI